MRKGEDRENVNEFGDIEAFKGTKYWFKRDIETIQNSLVSTLKFSPILIGATALLSLFYIRSINGEIINQISLIFTLSMSLLGVLAYFLLHVITTKGYDIHPYRGTHIKIEENVNRFSIKHILSSESQPGHKILHLIRLFFYLLFVIGLFLNILQEKQEVNLSPKRSETNVVTVDEEIKEDQKLQSVQEADEKETEENENNIQIDTVKSKDEILIFHNGRGPMCLEALEFFETIDYPVKEFLTRERDFRTKLEEQKVEFEKSEGISESFGYFPIIFIKDRAFSGFNGEVKREILKEVANSRL